MEVLGVFPSNVAPFCRSREEGWPVFSEWMKMTYAVGLRESKWSHQGYPVQQHSLWFRNCSRAESGQDVGRCERQGPSGKSALGCGCLEQPVAGRRDPEAVRWSRVQTHACVCQLWHGGGGKPANHRLKVLLLLLVTENGSATPPLISPTVSHGWERGQIKQTFI